MGEYEKVLKFYEEEMVVVDKQNNIECKGCVLYYLGMIYEIFGNYEQVVVYQEQYFKIVFDIND